MDKEKNNSFLKFLGSLSSGFFFGSLSGILMLFASASKHSFGLMILLVVAFYILLYRFAVKFNFSIIFGFSASVSTGLIVALIFLKGTMNLAEASKVFLAIFIFAFLNYLILKLIDHTFILIGNRHKQKNKREKRNE